jgi:hypothetical protein
MEVRAQSPKSMEYQYAESWIRAWSHESARVWSPSYKEGMQSPNESEGCAIGVWNPYSPIEKTPLRDTNQPSEKN